MDERALRTLEFYKIRELLTARASSALGRELCEAIYPATEYLEVKHRLEETSEACRMYSNGRSLPLGGIHDLRPSIQRAIRGGTIDPAELLDVADTASSGRRLKKVLLDARDDVPILAAVSNQIGGFNTLELEIRRAITPEATVADDASPALGQIRRGQRVIQSRIRDRMESYVRGPSAKYLQDPIITIRDDRYVIPVKIEHRAQVPGIVHDQSSSGSTLFIEPMAVVEMNNELKELALRERDEVARILARLTGLVAGDADSLIDSLQALAQIDFASAKAKLAMERNCLHPDLERTPMIEIKGGRHPLLKGEVVPVNVHLGLSFDTLVITGPNTGGKTVTLKTMGLFVLMTQSGLHIPAGYGTRIGIFDQIFVDIGDEQSIEQSLSTFSGHMTNIIRILDQLEGRALILMDELGAGTDPTEGSALAMSILDHLHKRGALTVATTHYSELKSFAYSRPRVENASVEFDVETLRPTYRLLIGIPGSSNAFEISRRLGLSDLLVDRAKQFITSEKEKVEDLITGINETRTQLEKDRADASRERILAQQMRADYEQRFGSAAQKAGDVVEKARAQAIQMVTNARREAEAVIDELKSALKNQRESDRMQTIQSARGRLSGARQALEDQGPKRVPGETPRGLKPGDAVTILSLGQTAYVLVEPDGSGQVLVQAGILKISVSLLDLERAGQPSTAAAPKRGSQGKGTGLSKAREIETELDLRGLTVDEALDKVDKHLDDAVMAGAPMIRIIHGKGTGALRKAVTDLLKSHPSVAAHRLGGLGEGGDGVTVATLSL